MKKSFYVFTATMFLIVFGINQVYAASKRYQIKSGQVKYQYSGGGGMGVQSGKESLVWINFGAKEKRVADLNIEVMGIKKNQMSTSIIDGEWAYSFNSGNKNATKVRYMELMQKMNGQSKGSSAVMYSEKAIKEFGGVKVGQKKVLKKWCDQYKMENFGTTVCLYKGIPLLTEINLMGMQTKIEAVEFKENVKIGLKEFQLPQGVNFVDQTKMVQSAPMPDAQQMRQAQEGFAQMNQAMKDSKEYQEFLEYQKVQKQKVRTEQNLKKNTSSSSVDDVVADVGNVVVRETGNAVKGEARRELRNTVRGVFRSLLK